MTRTQFIVLSLVSLTLVVLLLANVGAAYRGQTVAAESIEAQMQLNNSRRAEQILSQISMRIARDSDKDAALRDLLVKHQLKVTLEVDGKKKNYP